jgi:hypothetical protein
MDRKYIDDHHIVARYLADQLPDADREAFEAYYLRHPEILQEMEAAAQLKIGLGDLQRSGQLDNAISSARYRSSRPFAIAAAVTLGIAIGVLVWRIPEESPVLAARADLIGSGWTVVSAGDVMRMRSGSMDPLGTAVPIELPKENSVLRLRVLPEYEATPPIYRIALHRIEDDRSTRAMGEVHGLSADADGFVPLFLNSGEIQPGYYQITLSGETGTSAADSQSQFLVVFQSASSRE